MTQSLEYITKISHKHINNNHKKLKFSQIKELQEINKNLNQLFEDTKVVFAEKKFADIDQLLVSTKSNQTIVKEKINKQIERTRNEESSPKNTTLYFSLLVKTKELLKSNLYLLEEYNDSFDEKIKL